MKSHCALNPNESIRHCQSTLERKQEIVIYNTEPLIVTFPLIVKFPLIVTFPLLGVQLNCYALIKEIMH